MSSYKKATILKIVKDIERSKIYLPALQRKFVWKQAQISLLFDSLMRNFPIGTFLFWQLERDLANNYTFYEFLKSYDQREPYNVKKEGAFLHSEIIGVLDGQQRISSLYIGLQGTHTEKIPNKRMANSDAYRKCKLYLNLLSLPYFINDDNEFIISETNQFEFKFLTDDESKDFIVRKPKKNDDNINENIKDEYMYWFCINDVLIWGPDPVFEDKINLFQDTCKNEDQKLLLKTKSREIKKALQTLYNRIQRDEIINYFEIDDKKDLEDILNIFVRVNSGGTVLNKTDLLFSTIIATWNDGRSKIENFLKMINEKGDKFGFTNDYLMRCCLVLIDAPVLFKVASFKSENVQKIRDEWLNISIAIEKTVDLLVEFGFSKDLLTSQNSTIIIAYYIYNGGVINENIKGEIKKYLIHSLLSGVYGNQQDNLIAFLRKHFNNKNNSNSNKLEFSFNELLSLELPSKKSLYINENEINKYLTYKKGTSSFFVLSLLYPNLRYKDVQFHQDHIHPASKFKKETLQNFGLNDSEIKDWDNFKDMVPNLQLLEGRQNVSKNDSTFQIWLDKMTLSEQQRFIQDNYIPNDVDTDFKNFKIFFEKRKELLFNKLKTVLAINNDIQLNNLDIEDLIMNSDITDDSYIFNNDFDE